MSEVAVNSVYRFMTLLMNLMRAVADDSETYGTWQEEGEMRDFLLGSSLFEGDAT